MKLGAVKRSKKSTCGAPACRLNGHWTGKQATKVGFKGIEQRERFKRIHVAEVAAEGECVLAVLPGDVVHDLRAALLIEIRIAAVHARGKSVQHFQVGLRGNGREVERPVAVLETQFIHQMRE